MRAALLNILILYLSVGWHGQDMIASVHVTLSVAFDLDEFDLSLRCLDSSPLPLTAFTPRRVRIE